MNSHRLLLVFLIIALPSLSWAQSEEEPVNETSAESALETADAPLTTAEIDVPLEDLRVMVKPLTRAELKGEAEAWFELLRAKSRQIAALRLGVRKTSEAVAASDEVQAEAALKEVERINEKAEQASRQTEEEIVQSAQDNIGVEKDTPAGDNAGADSLEAAPKEQAAPSADVAAAMKDDLLKRLNKLQDQSTAIYDRLEIVLNSLEAKGGDVAEYRQYADAVARVDWKTSDAEAAFSAIFGWLTSREGGQRWAWNFARFVLTLAVAYLLAKMLSSLVNWLLERKINMSKLAERVIANSIKYVFLLVGFAVALTALEIDVTPILAAMGATGLVVGLALQDSLSNVASGMMILLKSSF